MNKAILWDLMGTLGGESSDVISADFKLEPQAISALKKANEQGFLNLIVTNQSQIAHGNISLEHYQQIMDRLLMDLEKLQAPIEKIFTCPHQRADRCACKKPQSLLGEKAIVEFVLDRKKCYMVGDSGPNDMLFAQNLGVKSVLVLTGEGNESLTTRRHEWRKVQPTYIATDCLDAVEKIIEESLI